RPIGPTRSRARSTATSCGARCACETRTASGACAGAPCRLRVARRIGRIERAAELPQNGVVADDQARGDRMGTDRSACMPTWRPRPESIDRRLVLSAVAGGFAVALVPTAGLAQLRGACERTPDAGE